MIRSLQDETLFYEVYMLRDGKVLRIDEYEERADALRAAGLSESCTVRRDSRYGRASPPVYL